MLVIFQEGAIQSARCWIIIQRPPPTSPNPKPEKQNPVTKKFFCSIGKTHEQGFETGKWNLKTGKFFVQPEKHMKQGFETGKQNPETEKFFVQPEKHMNGDLKPENGISKPESYNLNRKRT